MAVWEQAEKILNLHEIEISGKSFTFYIHNWGVVPKHFDNPIHRHSFYEIVYVVSGSGSYSDAIHTEEEREFPLKEGVLFCSRPGVWHQIRSHSGMYLLYVAFEIVEEKTDVSVLPMFDELKNTQKIVLPNQVHSTTMQLWRAILELAGTMQYPPLHETLSGVIYALLCGFPGLFSDQTAIAQRRTVTHSSTAQLRQAKLFIRDNLAMPLQLNDVASYLYVSGRHLSRLFSEQLGMAFSTYIRSERLRQTERLLIETDLSLKQIAEATGFRTIHYLSRIFRANYGIPPGQFRERAVKKLEIRE